MATQDGYVPYPAQLTAEEIVYSLNRALNLDVELKNYIFRTIGKLKPARPSYGDYYSDEDRTFIAYIEGSNVLWIEE